MGTFNYQGTLLQLCILEILTDKPKRSGISEVNRIRNGPYLQPIITQYFIDNKSEIWLLFLIAHSKR